MKMMMRVYPTKYQLQVSVSYVWPICPHIDCIQISFIILTIMVDTGPKTATKYIITGKTESVKSAAAQFEKILGLEPGSSKITDTTHKTNSMAEKNESNKDVNAQAGSNKQADGESDNGNDRGPSGKKVRMRKKKRGGKGPPSKGSNAKDSPAPPQAQVTDA